MDSDGDSDCEDFFYGTQVSILPNNLLETHAKPEANFVNGFMCFICLYLQVFYLYFVHFVHLHTPVAECRVHWGYQSALWGFQGISVGLKAAP